MVLLLIIYLEDQWHSPLMEVYWLLVLLVMVIMHGTGSGHTQVYQRDNTYPLGWTQIGDTIVGESSGDESGRSIALSANGNVVAVGAYLNGDTYGHVRVFEKQCLSLMCLIMN